MATAAVGHGSGKGRLNDMRPRTMWLGFSSLLAVCALIAAGLMTRAGVSGHARVALTRIEPDQQRGGPTINAEQAADVAYPRKTIPAGVYLHGLREARAMPRAELHSIWQELGPMNVPGGGPNRTNSSTRLSVSGRATAFAVDPSTCSASGCDTLYLGAAGGGVWKSTNGGQSWAVRTDGQPNIAIGSITVDPQNPNIVYVGTGDNSRHLPGLGILMSTDAGQSWKLLGQSQFEGRSVVSVIVDPRTAGTTNATLYVGVASARSGEVSHDGGDSTTDPHEQPLGFYVSTDGGQSWIMSNPNDNAQLRAGVASLRSLVMDPSNPNTLYGGFEFGGVFKSTDDGRHWTRLSGSWPSQYSTIQLALAQSNPQTVYAAFEDDSNPNDSGHLALFRSDNGGGSWTAFKNTPNSCDVQCYTNMVLAVDPTVPDTVYVGGTANYSYLNGSAPRACQTLIPLAASCNATLMKSADGGQTWSDVAENGDGAPIHPDAHAIAIDPAASGVLYVANDGGLYETRNAGISWQSLNNGLGTLQVDGIALAPNGHLLIGTQDNGTLEYRGSTTWTQIQDGDGGYTAFDPKNSSISYAEFYGASLTRNDRNGKPYSEVDIAPFWGDLDAFGRGRFYEPFVVAPSAPKDIFYGTYRIWRSKTRGGTDGNSDGLAWNDASDKTDWTPISFDLSCTKQPSNPSGTCARDFTTAEGISAVAVSPIDAGTVAAATANGQVWITHNALARVKVQGSCDPRKDQHLIARCNYVSGVHWTRITGTLPNRYPSSLTFAPGSKTSIYVTYSGFDESTPGASGHVYFSASATSVWTNLSNGLPDLPFQDVLVNPVNGHLYAAAEYGLYLSTNAGQSWSRIDAGLPASPAEQMVYEAHTNQLIVGTYGRGAWSIAAP